jgi:uncharacterized protein YdhG (YjbR/CyaY superfamily)
MVESSEFMEYIESLPIERKTEVLKLRAQIKDCYPDIEETMNYNLPSFKRKGLSLFQIASQKNFISFYISKALILTHKKDLSGISLGKGCIRFTQVEQINPKVLKKIIKGANEFPFELSKKGDSSR